MSEVHKAGYIHRDLKPENLFVKDVGGLNSFTIIDLGIAAVKDDHNTFAKTQTKAPEKTKTSERKLIQTTDLQANRTSTKGAKQNIKKLNNKVKKME